MEVTINVYAVPFVSPETVTGEEPVPVKDPGEDVTVYVVDSPPVAPAVNVITAFVFPATAVTSVGVCGIVFAVIEFELDDAADVPKLLVPVTENVYAVADCNPLTVIGEDDAVPVNPPGVDVARYEFGKPPPSPGENATDADELLYALPDAEYVVVPIVGIPGGALFATHP